MDMILVSNYVNNKRMFSMLDKLAEETFGITLQKWKEDGLLGDNYVPYSYVSDGKVLANVSANLYHMRIRGKEYPVIQIGTVMTDPSVRGRGLSGRLMRYVISLYEKESFLMFLFANENVMEFYPRFGFYGVHQRRYIYRAEDLRTSESRESDFRSLSWRNEKDRALILSIAGNRIPVSDQFGLTGSVSPRTIALSSEDMEGSIFYSENLDVICCMTKQEDRLLIQDLFPRVDPKNVGYEVFGDQFLQSLPLDGIREVECECMIDSTFQNRSNQLTDANTDVFFVRSSEPILVPGGRKLLPYDPAKERRMPIDLSGLRISLFDHT